ncbi:MAG: PepSY-like domain-containing protein [Alistipes sp.]|nr:PepSY-like domain-containing protein [Alistipes sp.]
MRHIDKIRTIATAALLLAASAAFADKPVTTKQLPQQARTFLTQYYPSSSVIYASTERELFDRSYETMLEDGTVIEFTKDGQWYEIKAPKGGRIPSAALPHKVAAYVKRIYPDAGVRQIEAERNKYEVELTNGVEITFNHNGDLLRTSDYMQQQPDHRFRF